MSQEGLEALQSLIESFADPDCWNIRWSYRCSLGAAGYVQFTVDLYPAGMTDQVRDTILATAARLVNWSHP